MSRMVSVARWIAALIGVLATFVLSASTAPTLALTESETTQVRTWLARQQGLRVLAIGESAHDTASTQIARNQLILDLAERDQIGTVLIESGFAESRKIGPYVSGKGWADQDLQPGLTNGFGLFAPNLSLLESLRRINASRPDEKKIRLLGIDLGAGGPWGAAPGIGPVDCALEGVDPATRSALRETFVRLTEPGLRGESFSRSVVTDYQSTARELGRRVRRDAPIEVKLCVRIVEQGGRLLETLPPGMPGPAWPSTAWQSIEARDRAMAENVRELLPRAGGKLTVLVTHASHAAASEMIGPRWSRLDQAPKSTGFFLRRWLGERYRSVLILADQKDTDCLSKTATSVIVELPEGPCSITVNGNDIQTLNLAAATDLAILPRALPREM